MKAQFLFLSSHTLIKTLYSISANRVLQMLDTGPNITLMSWADLQSLIEFFATYSWAWICKNTNHICGQHNMSEKSGVSYFPLSIQETSVHLWTFLMEWIMRCDITTSHLKARLELGTL